MQDDGSRDQTAAGNARAENSPASTTTKPRRRRWLLKLFGIVVVVPVALIAGWTAIALHWSYSEGNRAGYIQKFSHKGWVCKTWEGELAMVNLPGAAQERFLFSVRDDSVAQEITRRMGGHVTLTYEEHRGIPTSCFGDTQYYVKGVEQIP